MIGLDTNILARYYVHDVSDEQAARQRAAAKRLMESGRPLMVSKTVILEFEWVLRGYYGFGRDEILSVLRHMTALPQLTIEDSSAVDRAIESFVAGIDLADALHHASYEACDEMASFDDRKFARRAKKLALIPTVVVPR
jgi:predicted nucleic-acid-binding protein